MWTSGLPRPVAWTQSIPGHSGPAAVGILVLLFLCVFLLLPVVLVFNVAFSDAEGRFTLAHFAAFFEQALLRESFFNSVIVSTCSVAVASVIAFPMAYLCVRYEFRGGAVIQVLGVLPLLMPPFVGAVAMQTVFGPNGSVNLLLGEVGLHLPLMQGLPGVVFVESIHYFPFLLLSLLTSLRSIDRDLEEAAVNLGARRWRLIYRVVLPLAAPGYIAGAILVFVKVFDDLGTPLVLGATQLLAPQAYLRITSLGVEDPLGYVIGVLMVLFSLLSLRLSLGVLADRSYVVPRSSGTGLRRRPLRAWEAALVYGWLCAVLLVVLAPHIGILLMSFAKVWSYSILPEGLTLEHYFTVFEHARHMIGNTLLYCLAAAGIDLVLGIAIAYLVLRTRLPGRKLLDYLASSALAIPGLVLAIGYLRLFRGFEAPFVGVPLASFWGVLVIAYAVRRLPYTLRLCMAAMQQVHGSMEEAAHTLGAGRTRTLQRIVLPLMMGGVLSGFVTSFVTAAVELSATIVLTSRESDAPMSYGFYIYMQTASGRGPGAALGVIAIVLVAVGAYLSHRVVSRSAASTRAEP